MAKIPSRFIDADELALLQGLNPQKTDRGKLLEVAVDDDGTAHLVMVDRPTKYDFWGVQRIIYTAPDVYYWTVPDDCKQVWVTVVGGGGHGGKYSESGELQGGGGGSGGCVFRKDGSSIALPGRKLTIFVGAGMPINGDNNGYESYVAYDRGRYNLEFIARAFGGGEGWDGGDPEPGETPYVAREGYGGGCYGGEDNGVDGTDAEHGGLGGKLPLAEITGGLFMDGPGNGGDSIWDGSPGIDGLAMIEWITGV